MVVEHTWKLAKTSHLTPSRQHQNLSNPVVSGVGVPYDQRDLLFNLYSTVMTKKHEISGNANWTASSNEAKLAKGSQATAMALFRGFDEVITSEC